MNSQKRPCLWLTLAFSLIAAVTAPAAELRSDEQVIFIPSLGSQTAVDGG